MSSPSTTASSIPTTPTTPFSLPSPLPNLDAAMNPSMKSSSHSMPHLSLPPPVVPRPRRIALHPSFKLQAPPVSLRSRTAIIEEQEDEEGCDKLEIHVPTIVLPAKSAEPAPVRPRVAPLAPSNTAPAPPAILSPSATRPNKTFADAVAGRNPPPPAPIASSSTMSFGKLSGQPRSTKAGARTHRRAQSISMSVSDSAGFAPRRAPLAGSSDSQEQVLMVPRRPSSLTPSPRMVHFAPIPETDSDHPPRAPRAAHPRVSALAPPHPGLRSFGLAPPSRLHSREDSTPRALANSGRIIALPSFEDDAFTSMRGSSYAFGTNPVAIAVGRGFDQWGQ